MSEEEVVDHTVTTLFLLLLVTVLLGCFLLQHYLVTQKCLCIPTAVVTLLLSSSAGLLFYLISRHVQMKTTHLLAFSSQVFYFALLPCIIFNAGYHIHRRIFFRNWLPIVVLALIGTWIGIALLAFGLQWMVQQRWLIEAKLELSWTECLAFSALLASTDPVCTLALFSSLHLDADLFYLVLGESMLNDAVALAIFHAAVQASQITTSNAKGDLLNVLVSFVVWLVEMSAVFLLSSLLGYALGLLLAVIVRRFDFSQDKLTPLCLILSLGYLAFLIGESLHLSSIVVTFFAGLSAEYLVANTLTLNLHPTASLCVESAGYAAEVSSMVIMGLSLALFPLTSLHLLFTALLFILLLGIRAVQVYGGLGLVNMYRLIRERWKSSDERIPGESTHNPLRSSTMVDCSVSISSPICEEDCTEETKDINDDNVTNRTFIPFTFMHVVWLSGMRGALNYSLATTFPNGEGHRDFVLASTGAIIVVGVCILGASTQPFLHLLGLKGSPAIKTDDQPRKTLWEEKHVDGFVLRGNGPVLSLHSLCCYQPDDLVMKEDEPPVLVQTVESL